MLRFATGSILSLGLLAAAPAASAQSVVLQASGPTARHFPVGGSLPDEAVVALQVGDRLTVTGPRGVRTYVGPGNFSVLYNPQRRRTRVRGPGAAPPPPGWEARERFFICPGHRRCPG